MFPARVIELELSDSFNIYFLADGQRQNVMSDCGFN